MKLHTKFLMLANFAAIVFALAYSVMKHNALAASGYLCALLMATVAAIEASQHER